MMGLVVCGFYDSPHAVYLARPELFPVALTNVYAKLNGTVALYYVQDDLVPMWDRNLRACGFPPGRFRVFSKNRDLPPIPDFSDE